VTPPSSPGNVAVSGATGSSVSISWSGSTDNVGVAGYGLYRGSTLVGTTTDTTYLFSGLSCGAGYTVAVDAFDAAGNRSPRVSLNIATGPCPDTSAPSAPTGLTITAATTTSVSLFWNVSTDNVAVTGYNLYLNGSKVGSTAATGFGFAGLGCGTSYTLSVEAYDAAGNRSPRSSLAAATSPCPDVTPPTAPSYVVVSAASATTISVLWGVASDDVAVAGYDLFVNGKKIGSTSATSYTFAGLTCGTAYTLTVDAYDAAGNRSTPTAATATTTACPAIAAGVKLAFAPPALASPTTILLGNPTRSLSLNAAKDYILELPPYPVKPGPDGGIWVDGGHNIVIIGGAIDFTGVVNSCCTEDQGRVATFMNTTGTVHVEGLWAYGSGLVEGIQMFSPQASLQVENCRFDHLHTTQYALHSDLIQFNDGRDLRVDRFTGSSEVQGVFRTNPEGGAAILDHVNMQGLQGSSDSSPRLLWQGGDWWPMALDNVWIQPRSGQPIGMAVWPGTTYSNNAYAAFINPDGTLGWSAATRISGVVHAGVPTNGDFVPVGVAGASYVSPGY
jgi:chitodextrinase